MKDLHFQKLHRSYYSSVVKPQFKREYLRAPLKSSVLYDSDGNLLHASVVNISEGGILVANLPHYPEKKDFFLLLDLIAYPTFSRLSYEKIISLELEQFERNILNVKCKIVRTFEGMSSVEKLFINNIGVQFAELTGKNQALVHDYVEVYKRNIVYFLGLFEDSQADEKNRLIRKLAYLFGYGETISLPELRSQIQYEYQSLEKLQLSC